MTDDHSHAHAIITQLSRDASSIEDFLSSAEESLSKLLKDKHADWSPVRQRLFTFLEDTRTECALCFVILLNMVLLVCEADDNRADWLSVPHHVLLSFFTFEMIIRLYTYRCDLFCDVWSAIDAIVISADVICFLLDLLLPDLPSLGMLRIVRLLRLSRMSKFISLVPQLHIIVTSLAGAMNTLFWGLVMLMLMLTVWGILAVELLKPLNDELARTGAYADCERCPRAFSTVWDSGLTFAQQIIAGDSWGLVSLPIIEHQPASAVFFLVVFVSLNMALMNIILASVVDAVTQARCSQNQFIVEEKQKELKAARRVLEHCCHNMDIDGNGTLTYKEVEKGYSTEPAFRMALEAMDVKAADLPTLCRILDQDGSGDVSLDEFCDQIHKMKTADPHTMLVFMKHYTSATHKEVHETLNMVKDELLILKEDDTKIKAIDRSLSHLPDEKGSLSVEGKNASEVAPTTLKKVDIMPISKELQAKDRVMELQPYLDPVKDIITKSEEAIKDLILRFEIGLSRFDDLSAALANVVSPVLAQMPSNIEVLETKLDWLPTSTCCGMKGDTQRAGETRVLLAMPNKSSSDLLPEVIRRGTPPGFP